MNANVPPLIKTFGQTLAEPLVSIAAAAKIACVFLCNAEVRNETDISD